MKKIPQSLLFISLLFQQSMAQDKQPDIIWYDKPAKVFEEAIPIGNGQHKLKAPMRK